MKTKTCTKCYKIKLISEFNKQKKAKDGHSYWCKECVKEYQKENKKKIKKQKKRYYLKNKEKFIKKVKKWNKEHREKRTKYMQKYYQDNKEKLKQSAKKYREKYKEEYVEYMKKYRNSHKKVMKKYLKEYHQTHKKEANKYQQERRKMDVNFKTSQNLRTRINIAIKNNSKSLPTMSLIGCDIEYLMYHLQKQFTSRMNWDNYATYWEIDHIKPFASFDLSKAEEQQKVCYYTNQRPLTIKQNRSKGGRYVR